MVQRLKRDGLHDHDVEREYHKELHKLNARLLLSDRLLPVAAAPQEALHSRWWWTSAAT